MATVLTNVGEQFICDKLSEVVATQPEFAAWGTGAGTAAKGDTTLFTEAAEARVSGTITTEGTGATAKFQNVATITSLSGQTITNAGLFTASSGGTLVIKGDFTGIVLATNDKIEFTFTLDPS
jgi:hypothetical protein